jgi:hypothetical protein
MTLEVFVSYSHEDEWLKNEFLKHAKSLERNGIVSVWHDRKITAGAKLSPEIEEKLEVCHVFLFLISPAFIASDYCMDTEYKRARERSEKGEAVVIPVIVRECDWDVYGLRDFLAVPTDGLAVVRAGADRVEEQQRDAKWVEVVKGLKEAVNSFKKKLQPPELLEAYKDNLFKVDFVRHPAMQVYDEGHFFVDPELYFEKEKRQINQLAEVVDLIYASKAAVFVGSDRSGKTVLAKKLQSELTRRGEKVVLLRGGDIKNADIQSVVSKADIRQYGVNSFPSHRTSVIIDDFDDVSLPDNIKEKIVRTLATSYKSVVIIAFTSAPTVLFSTDDLPDPIVLSLTPLGDEKVYSIVRRWKLYDSGSPRAAFDAELIQWFQRVMTLFSQTEAEKYAYNVITFLELLDTALGNDIAPSSFAGCYETLMQTRLLRFGVDVKQLDEYKNFAALVAFKAYKETKDGFISEVAFKECSEQFAEQYLSSARDLFSVVAAVFLEQTNSGFHFREDYIWYFLTARYVGRRLASDDRGLYEQFVDECVQNIFQKKFANIVIYLAYFTEDNLVVRKLMDLLDRLFSKASDWRLSDKSRSIILGIATSDQLAISSASEVEDNRVELLKAEVRDIVNSAEEVVARFTLPFLDADIADSELVDEMNHKEINGDSYIKSVNALMRAHSVIGQILSARSGTYGAELVMNCITKMVQASGRYTALNHSIATVLLYDREFALRTAKGVVRSDGLSDDEKYEKVMRIFAFWSVFLSQTGLARYLAQPHSIRALERLVAKHEAFPDDDGHYPYNFLSVLLISKLYATQAVDRAGIDSAIEKLGKESGLFAVLRATFHIYSYYMPMSIQDKQWLSQKLRIPIRAFEMQKLRANRNKDLDRQSLLEFRPDAESDKDSE